MAIEENVRVNNLKSRFESIRTQDAGLPALKEIDQSIVNGLVYFRDSILNESDHALAESRMAAIESKQVEINARKVVNEIDEVRKVRNKQLTATDWSQLADAPLTQEQKTEYREYRQYLRDIPELYENQQILTLDVMVIEDWRLNKPVY